MGQLIILFVLVSLNYKIRYVINKKLIINYNLNIDEDLLRFKWSNFY